VLCFVADRSYECHRAGDGAATLAVSPPNQHSGGNCDDGLAAAVATGTTYDAHRSSDGRTALMTRSTTTGSVLHHTVLALRWTHTRDSATVPCTVLATHGLLFMRRAGESTDPLLAIVDRAR